MPSKTALRRQIESDLDEIAKKINSVLRGRGLKKLEPTLKRIGRGGTLPHWYERLRKNGSLPNLDGKTIGSVVEMLLVGVLENHVFEGLGSLELRVNPARGVDLPDLDLGVKSPSENYCTSEPFFSAYERLLGSEYDILVLLTDYQTAKLKPPLQLQVIKWRYLRKSQVADESLCRIARKHKRWLLAENESWAKKVFRFLAFVNQSDWRAKKLLKLIDCLRDEEEIETIIQRAEFDFQKKNDAALRAGAEMIPESELKAIQGIRNVTPIHCGVIDSADNWVIEIQKEAGRAPNDNEWNRLLRSPLDGKIGMSFALQWRYNFGHLFKD